MSKAGDCERCGADQEWLEDGVHCSTCIANAELCDEHEWAGYGDCPKCVAEHPEKYGSSGDPTP